MNRSTVSEGTRRLAYPKREDWPRVGAKIENGMVVVRVLDEGEDPCDPVKRAVVIAEPCNRFPTLSEAIVQAANAVVARLEKSGCAVPIAVRLN